MVSFCRDYGIDHAFQGKNISRGWLGLQDPWKGHDTGYHLGWNLSGGYLHSWSTGGHSLYSWMRIVTPSVNYHTALESYGDYIDDRAFLKKKTTHAESVPFDFDDLSKVAKKYLEKRGFDPDELAKKYNLRDGGFVGDFKFRVIAPIYQDGIIVAYQGRDYTNSQTLRYKMLALEKTAKNPKHCLYNKDNCKSSHLVAVEGMYDCWKWGDGCVATMGTSVTQEQIREMAKFKKVTLIFDSEVPAQERAKKIATSLSALGVPSVEVIDTETEKDLGAMTFDEVDKIKEIVYG